MPTNPNPFLRSSFDAVASEPVPQVAMPELENDPAPAATPAATGVAAVPVAPAAAPRKMKLSGLAPPPELRAVFEGSAMEFDVPVNVLMAIAHQESRYDSQSVNPASGAKGIMNYMDATSGAMKFNPLDPNEAIPAAAMQIRERLDKGYSMADAVKEHFAGPDRAGWKGKTARYGDEVLAKAGEIGKLLYPEPAPQPVGPNENNFSPKLARADYYANFVRLNLGAAPDAIQAVMAQYDADAARRTAAGGNSVQEKFAEMASPDATFNAKLNAKLQAGNKGVAQVLPANAQPANPVAQESSPGERLGIGAQAAGDFGRGIDNLKALGYGIAGLAADATGHDAAADEYLKKYVAIENDTAKNNPATIGSYKKVGSLGDAGRYAIEAVFENLPMLLPSLVTGGVGVGLAKKAAEKLVVGMVEGQVAKGVAREVAEQQAAKFVARTILAGSAAGAAPATIGMESGSIMGDIYKETGKKEAGTALAYGIPAGLLDTLQPVMALRKIAGPVADQVAGGILKRLGVEAGKQFIVEAGTEGLQTIIEQAGVTSVSGKKLFTPELLDQVIDATLKGGIGGAGIGMASQGIQEARGAMAGAINNPATVPGEAAAPAKVATPRGPLESAMHAAAPPAPVAPAEPAAAAAPAAVETFTIEGDDGTLHQLDAATSTITPVAPAGPLVSAIGAAAESHAASLIAAPEIPQPPPEPPALESLAVDALHTELKRVATTIKESGRTAELVTERKAIEKEIGQRAKEARDATAKLAEEPTSLGPFATVEEANKMAPRVAEQSAVVHEVVKKDGKFILQPYKEPSDGNSPVLPEGADDRSGSAGNAAGAGTADGAGHQGPAAVPGVDRADAGRPVAKVQPDPVRAGAAADPKPALKDKVAPKDEKPEWETNPYHARQFADQDLAVAFMEKNKVDPAKFEAVQTGKARWKLQPKAEAPAVADLTGKAIDKEWHEFAKDSGTLNVDRAEMPQVRSAHRGALTQFLLARGIAHEQIEMPAADLKPTQREFSPAKVQKARDFVGGDRSILVSSDNHVLDGHHQWLAKLDANEPVKVIRLDAPIKQLLEEVEQFPSAAAADGATAAAPASEKVPEVAPVAAQAEPKATPSDAEFIADAVSQADRQGLKGKERKADVVERMAEHWSMTKDEVVEDQAIIKALQRSPKKADKTAATDKFVQGVIKTALEASAAMQVQIDAADAKAAPKPLDHGELNIPNRTKNIDAELGKHQAAQAKAAKTDAKDATAQKKIDKARAKELFAEVGEDIIDRHGEKLGAKELRKHLDQMVKWEPKKFIKMAEKHKAEVDGDILFDIPSERTIEVDGVRRPINNSRGQLVAPTFAGQVAFWKWFADSAMVDSRGRPEVLYHGTSYDFDKPKGVFWAASDPAFASYFAAGREFGDGDNVMPTYLAVKKPVDMRGLDIFQWLTRAQMAEHIGITSDELGVAMAGKWDMGVMQAHALFQAKEFVAGFKRLGFDGVVWSEVVTERGVEKGRSDTFAAFNATQVKSATGNNGDFKASKGNITHDLPHKAIALDLNSEQARAWMADGPLSRMDEPKRVMVLTNLKRLQKLRGAGKIDDQSYRRQVEVLIGRIGERNEVRENAEADDKERGPEWIEERLLRAKRHHELDAGAVDFALWALRKSPALAADLAISIRATSANGTSGSYQSADRIMTLFASTANDHTAVHEMLHHTERMMPKAIQQGIARAWLRAYSDAWTKADAPTRLLLDDLLASGAGDKKAHERVLKAFREGKLEYDRHYQLVNASEFWAVNATRIMGGRFDGAVKGWAGKAKQWLKEMVQYAKGALRLRSDAPILKGLADVLNGTGERQSPMMLGQLPVASDIAKQTESAAFQKWFAGSHVVDADGKPLRMFHGTDKDFASFDKGLVKSRFPYSFGLHFTDRAQEASIYADSLTNGAENFNYKSKFAKPVREGAVVMPVFLAAKNPLTIVTQNMSASMEADLNRAEIIAQLVEAKRAGKPYDSVIIKRERGDEWDGINVIVFAPEQVKSATGNNGNFDQSDDFITHDITAGSPPAAADDAATDADGLTPPDQGFLRRLQSTVQDNLNRVKQVQERIAAVSGAPVTVAADYYGAETNRPGRIAARLEDAQDKLTGPLMERLAKSGFKPEQLNELLHAMHAHERNEAVAQINPEFPDGGSGMTDAQANAIIERYKGNAELLEMAQQARDIAGATLDLKRAYGLITADQHELLNEMYENYVPLKGDGEYGPKVKRAMGHGEREEFIMDNIARDYAQAVVVGEKNLARQSLLQMVLRHPDADLWTARVPPKGRYVAGTVLTVKKGDRAVAAFTSASQVSAFLEAKGAEAGQYTVETSAGEQVVEFTKPLQDNEVMVYVKGQPVRLQIHDEKLASQLRPLDNGQMNVVLEFMRHVNRHLSKVYTGYNPSFIIRNTARDALTGTINMLGNEGGAITAKAWSNYPRALATLIGWAHSKKIPAGRMGGYLSEYRDHGGKVGASWMSDLEQQGKSLTEMYDNARGLAATVRDTGASRRTATVAWNKTVGKLAHVIEVANQGTENALRLSLFVALRESGATPGKAAQAAKGVTVDFDRKGTATPTLGAVFLFFNPAVQGTTNAGKTLFKGKHKGQAWAALGALSALGYFLAAAGMDDDRDRWLGESWEVRSKNFMYRAGEHQIKIPVSQEFAPFFALGMAMAEAGRGESKVKASVHVVSGFLDAYFPLNIQRAGSDNPGMDLVGGVVPTIVKPYFEIWSNRSSFGSVVVPESEFTKDRPDNLKMNRGTKNSPYDKAAQGIAAVGEAVGARPYENDISKVSPETLKLLWRTYTGGLGTFIADSVGVAGMAFDGAGQITSGDVPIAKDFVRPLDIKPVQGRFYDLQRDTQRVITEFKQATKAGDGAAVQKIASDPDSARVLGLTSMITKLNKAAGQLSDLAVDVNADKSLTGTEKRARLKEIDAQKEQLYRAGIGAFTGKGN